MNDSSTLPPGVTPSVPRAAASQECMAVWLDLMNACEQFLLAGMRREIGPDGDLQAAYRRWYAEQMEEHDRTMLQMIVKLDRRGGGHAR